MSESLKTREKLAQVALRRFTVTYAIMLLCMLIAIEWWAETWLPLAILSFAPPIIMAVPLFILLPITAFLRLRCLFGIQAVCLASLLFVFMTCRIHSSGSKAAITVITHNVGQGNGAAFVDSFPAEKPDAVILQDVSRADIREIEYRRRYPSYRTRGIEQFILLTPHEVESAGLVSGVLWHGKPVAARFLIKVNERSVAIYSIHLPTPRSSLAHIFSPRVAMEMLWLTKAPTDGFSSYREWLNARVALARSLADVFKNETNSFIVGGDFNMPDHGIVYHTFASNLKDAFVTAGSGWGMTFPGSREGRMAALLGPWLRLDYWFAGRGWHPVDCLVAKDALSQHRAVLARFDAVQ